MLCNWLYRTLLGDNSIRQPKRAAAYADVFASIRRMFMRPDFVAALRSNAEVHDRHHNDHVLYDVCDGSAWDNHYFGLERTLSADGTVSDVNTHPDRHLSLGFGLFAGLNLDWFKITEKYSVEGIYLSILNLPRSVRNLPWNMILACTIPGPGEPSLEGLNHVVQPVVNAFKQLYAGESMNFLAHHHFVFDLHLPSKGSPCVCTKKHFQIRLKATLTSSHSKSICPTTTPQHVRK